MRKFGTLQIDGKDINITDKDSRVDRIAVSDSNYELVMVSLIAEAPNLKRIRAAFASNVNLKIQSSGLPVKQPSQADWYAKSAGFVRNSAYGYNVETFKLKFGWHHAMFISRTPGFMRVMNTEALWRELKDPRFTTPLLKEWMPYIEKRLRYLDLLEECRSYGCECGMLTANTGDLDDIVSKGLQNYEITIPQNTAQEETPLDPETNSEDGTDEEGLSPDGGQEALD